MQPTIPVSYTHLDVYKRQELAQISEATPLYTEVIIYILAVIVLSFGISQIPLYYFRSRTLQSSIRNKKGSPRRGIFRRLGPVSYTHLDVYKRQL